ncbi:MAG: hypothetical protein EP330_30555 [Deltaproteobacteria bacterium]|nr:MAG: hypothetical protein EP330_30555 [Deltaproteobacteria bacterium]
MPVIELLHTPGCRTTVATRALNEEVAAQMSVSAKLVVVDVDAHPEARVRFAGSPTVLVDGRDIEPEVEPAPGAG